jgi:cell division transport system ATP-binding protein
MVHLEHLSYNFGRNWAIKDVTFSVEKGEFVFLTGSSGAGKTTLLRLLYGALPVTRGSVKVAGFDLNRLKRRRLPDLRRRVGVVFQDFKILARRTVFDNVALALEVRGMARQVRERRVRAILRALGLEHKSYSRCRDLSGGEQQRVAIARSMVGQPSLILADEPTGNLDLELSLHLMGVFKQFNDYGATVVMATHNRDVLEAVPEARVERLKEGRLVGREPSGEALE